LTRCMCGDYKHNGWSLCWSCWAKILQPKTNATHAIERNILEMIYGVKGAMVRWSYVE